MFARLDKLTARPVLVLVVSLAFVAAMMVLGSGAASRLLSGGTEDLSSESARATEVIDERFPGSRPNLVLLVRPTAEDTPVEHPDVVAAGEDLVERLEAEEGVTGVTSYWTSGALPLRSTDGQAAMITARITGDENTVSETFTRLAPEFRGEQGDVAVELGGEAAVRTETESTVEADTVRGELFALPITLVILLFVFRSVVAALVPLIVGVVTIATTNGVLRVITEFADVSIFAQNLATGLGLGLAIDYALLFLRRYREERERRPEVRRAVGATIATAGRTVVFSALTVAVALSSMLVFPQYFLRSFAYAGIPVVLFCAAAVLVLVPAALVLLGDRIDALDVYRMLRLRRRAAATESDERQSGRTWYRLAVAVMRRAPLFAVGTTALLLLLAVPFLRVELGPADHRQLPGHSESRQVAEAAEEEFPGRADGGIDVLLPVTAEDPAEDPLLVPTRAAELSEMDGVFAVVTPLGTFQEGALAYAPTPVDTERIAGDRMAFSVVPEEDIAAVSPESRALVEELREIPGALVTGQAATFFDAQDALAERLPVALAIIVVAALVLMFLFTGSVLVSVQTLVLNGLSLTVMFGAAVWIWQDGNGAALLGFDPIGQIETTLPVLMFCLTFGLSMDYNIIVLSRIKEEYDRGGDHRAAIALGLQRTGGLVTAAALILAVVLFGIGSSQITNMQMLGIGVALAILMDATVVRGFLLPALMALTGRATWWAPAPLQRFQRRFGLRDEPEPDAPPADPAGPAPHRPVPAAAPAPAAARPGGEPPAEPSMEPSGPTGRT
ncbi:MMPL family transporter [Streptomonospora nanhaiensis]|uniref:RND superfamily putative drug exporter n=1 Tax=Streptomonospora nanhaiensis TaxID=1323731 RepID=A0A853BIL7_9ACTN|nr:MMPL family transporter [Streptomonospora nanhaiensis]MBV2362918.1 MMPL family transporter [Streptomonospora nanhaiensis]MBX9391663.1 MMPL family transporter [Streptomonospora nanhaiensis]NYI95279.1 RND superfamily putative drug exporter [Streptomonospora nanhaiensis]